MFEQLRRHLDSAPRDVDVFFRDDDADTDLPELRRLLDAFAAEDVPLNLAVVPGTLTAQCAELIKARPKVEPHQHGWIHANHETDGRKCEFGRSRSYEQQLMDIARGKQRMTELMGGRWAPIFTPPWNRCTEDTCRALTTLAFEAISKDRTTPRFTTCQLPEVSTSVDIFRWKNGRRLKTEDEIGTEFQAGAGSAEPVGVLLHHKVMDFAAFELLAGLLAALRNSGRCRFHTLTSARRGRQ